MTEDPSIKANAALVVETCRPLVHFPFGYDERSVAWLEGYIERQRTRDAFEQSFDKLAGIFGCYLGEAIIANFSGEWAETADFPLHVLLEGENRAFPFANVPKQMKEGLDRGESILGFFRSIPAIISMYK